MENKTRRVKWVIAWAVLVAASAGVFFVWYAGGIRLKERPGGGTPPPLEPMAQAPAKSEHGGHEGRSMPASQEPQKAAGEMVMAPGAIMVSPERQQLIGLKTGVVGHRSINCC